MVDYYYQLGPWVRGEILPGRDGWLFPDGAIGVVALRSTSDDASDGGMGFWWSAAPIPGYTQLGQGDCREMPVTVEMLDAWEDSTGKRPSGATLVELLAWHLTEGSDIDGVTAVPPLMPTRAGNLEICLQGHSKVWSRRFVWTSDPHAAKVKQQLQRKLKAIRTDSKAGKCNPGKGKKGDTTFHQQYAMALMEKAAKWGLTDFEELRPNDWPKNEKPLKHGTTIGDTFTDTNGTALSSHTATGDDGGHSWAASGSDLQIQSNALSVVNTGIENGRAESDLASDDHYCEITVNNADIALCNPEVRMTSGSYNGYTFYWASWLSIYRIMQMTADTQLASVAQGTNPGTGVYRLEADGSTLTAYFGGAQVLQTTDPSYSGFTRCGVTGYKQGDNPSGDNWEAGDLATPPLEIDTSDTAGLSTSVARKLTAARLLTNTAGLTDALARKLIAARSVADTAGLSDAVQISVIHARPLADNLGLSDAASTKTGHARSVEDTAGLSDAVAINTAHARLVSDSAGLSDIASASMGAATKTISVSDTLGVSDAVQRVAALARSVADTLGVTDAVARAAVYGRVVSDTAGLSDAVSRKAAFLRAVSDSAGLSDELAALLSGTAKTISVSDLLGIADELFIGKRFDIAVDDALGLSDALSRRISYPPSGPYRRQSRDGRPYNRGANSAPLAGYVRQARSRGGLYRRQ